MNTVILKNEITGAAEIIKNGGLVVVPTETVYGLAANGLDEDAVEKLYVTKGRPETKPISLFVLDMDYAEKFCCDIPKEAYALAKKYWPGSLTMIFRHRNNVPDITTAGGDTIGVRCPNNALTLELLRQAGVPLTGTSANISGMTDAKNVREAFDYFHGKVECIIDGGECTGGVPSTVIDMTVSPVRIIREGALSRKEIESVLAEV